MYITGIDKGGVLSLLLKRRPSGWSPLLYKNKAVAPFDAARPASFKIILFKSESFVLSKLESFFTISSVQSFTSTNQGTPFSLNAIAGIPATVFEAENASGK